MMVNLLLFGCCFVARFCSVVIVVIFVVTVVVVVEMVLIFVMFIVVGCLVVLVVLLAFSLLLLFLLFWFVLLLLFCWHYCCCFIVFVVVIIVFVVVFVVVVFVLLLLSLSLSLSLSLLLLLLLLLFFVLLLFVIVLVVVVDLLLFLIEKGIFICCYCFFPVWHVVIVVLLCCPGQIKGADMFPNVKNFGFVFCILEVCKYGCSTTLLFFKSRANDWLPSRSMIGSHLGSHVLKAKVGRLLTQNVCFKMFSCAVLGQVNPFPLRVC